MSNGKEPVDKPAGDVPKVLIPASCTRVIGAAVLLVGLVACGSSSTTSSASSASSSSSTSSSSSAAASSPSPSPAAQLPADVCSVLAAADLNAILSPPTPFSEGKATTAASGSTSKGCEWLSGSPTANDFIDVIVVVDFYNPNAPFSTAGLEPVNGLGDDTAYFSTNVYGMNKLRARKGGVLVNVLVSKKESHDQGLAHTRAVMEKVLAKV
jgi:hypothetical protein